MAPNPVTVMLLIDVERYTENHDHVSSLGYVPTERSVPPHPMVAYNENSCRMCFTRVGALEHDLTLQSGVKLMLYGQGTTSLLSSQYIPDQKNNPKRAKYGNKYIACGPFKQ